MKVSFLRSVTFFFSDKLIEKLSRALRLIYECRTNIVHTAIRLLIDEGFIVKDT